MKPFRVKIPTLWHQASQGLFLGALIARLQSLARGEAFSLPDELPLMAMTAVAVIVAYFLQPTMAGKPGIKAMTFWGFRRQVPWPEIASVTFARLYYMQPSLKLTDRQGRSYWIARDTKDLPGLHAMAIEFGGVDHPLTRALETPMHAL